MSLKDITITGSIGSIATQSYGQRTYISSTDEQSFPIEHITGSDAKVWPNFVQGTDYTVGLVVNVTQSWSGSNVTPLGYVPYVHNTMEEFIDGEFSGSNYVVTDGNLNDAQCEQFLTINTTPVEYVRDTTLYDDYYDEGVLISSDFSTFTGVTPSSGEFILYQKTSFDGVLTTTRSILWVKISKLDNFGNDNTISLQELKSFKWKDNNAGEITLTVLDIVEHSSYFLYQVYSKSWTTGALSNTTVNVVISPYLLSNFANSDCDVLINNTSQNDISGFYREVLYENGGTIPSNFQQIISGTAEYAQVNDYLFNAKANTLPRYEGVRVTQQQLNKWTLGDISPSQTPSVTDLQTYFAYYDYIQSTSYELKGKSAAHILYLIDKDGTILTPTLTGSYYSNLIDNFETDKNANVIVDTSNGERIFLGNKRIIRPGVLPRAIIESQTGSSYNIQSIIEWETLTDNTPNYISTFTWPSGILSVGISQLNKILPITLETVPSLEVDVNPNENSITINKTSLSTTIQFYIEVKAYGYQDVENKRGGTNIGYNIDLQKWNGSSWVNIERKGNIIGYSNYGTLAGNNFGLTTTYILFSNLTPTINEKYRFNVYNGSGYESVRITPSTKVNVLQNPTPAISSIFYGPALTPPTASLVYWTTGSNSKNILTSSVLFPAYNTSPAVTQLSYSASGYGPNLPFTIQPFIDSIRFEGNENYSFIITDVFTSANTGSFDTDFTTWYNSNPSTWTLTSNNATALGNGGGYITQSLNISIVPDNIYYINFTLSSVVGTPGDTQFIMDFVGGIYTGSSSYPPNNVGYYLDSYVWFISGLSNGTYSVPIKGPLTAPLINPDGIRIISTNANVGDSFTISDIYISSEGQNSLYLKLNKEIDDIIDINSFLIRRLNPHPNFIVLDSSYVSGSSGFIFPEYSTNELRENFDKISVDLKEKGLI